ncbi:MAG: hypothetical protein KFF49_08885 [Bacteroidales bacterium]|nr:hypothetical protein [Bacteroidales bacterium]
MKASLKFLCILLFVFPSLLIAQDDFRGFSVNPRLGTGYPLKYTMGVHAGAELCLYRNEIIYSAEYTFHEEFILFGEESFVINKIGFYYGKYWGKNWFRYQVQGGLGPVWGRKMVSEYYSSFIAPAAFLKAGLKLIPVSFAAIGADIQLNLNPEIPNLMLMVGVDLGKLINPK